jgi:hypothetical protein
MASREGVDRNSVDPVTSRLLVTAMPFDGATKSKNLNGSPGRARTADLVINSHPLYQLSYRGITEPARARIILDCRLFGQR